MQVKPAPGIRFDGRYGLLSVAYLTGIYWLSSSPDLGVAEGSPLVALVSNLSHAPLFAGLAFCVLKSLSGAQEVSGARYGLAFVVSAACAALDEWHQSFVPGRLASAGDFLVDVAGIGAMLLLLRLRAPRGTRPVRSASPEGSTTAWRQVMKRLTEGRSATSLWLVATMLVCAAGS